MTDLLHSPAVLALELAAGTAPQRLSLTRDEAAELARHLADDLARLLPGAQSMDLVLCGALYDQTQLLRPDWPIYAQLAELALRAAPAERAGHVLAFGSHEGVMPAAVLQPETGLTGGVLLLLPWMLSGPAEPIAALGQRMEREFVARAEAGPRTADFLMRSLGVRLEHARLLTRHDACALACVQLEHVGFSALWQMLEPALLAPARQERALSSRGRSWRYADGAAHTDVPDFATWFAEHGHALEPVARIHAYAGWLFELRQYAALLAAHRVALRLDDSAHAHWPLQQLADADPAAPAPQLLAHEARGLGIVMLTVAQAGAGGAWRTLARAWPLDAAALPAMTQWLAERYGAEPALQRLGPLRLDWTERELALV